MNFKIVYFFNYEMDYKSNTKRYGNYIFKTNNKCSIEEAKELFLKAVGEGTISLNPILNITKGKIIRKTIEIEKITYLK